MRVILRLWFKWQFWLFSCFSVYRSFNHLWWFGHFHCRYHTHTLTLSGTPKSVSKKRDSSWFPISRFKGRERRDAALNWPESPQRRITSGCEFPGGNSVSGGISVPSGKPVSSGNCFPCGRCFSVSNMASRLAAIISEGNLNCNKGIGGGTKEEVGRGRRISGGGWSRSMIKGRRDSRAWF